MIYPMTTMTRSCIVRISRSKTRSRQSPRLVQRRTLLPLIAHMAQRHTPSNHTRSQFVPRLDREKTLKSVEWLLIHYRGWFKDPEGAGIAWRALCNSLPERVEDVHEPPMWDWPSKCKDYSQNLPPDLAASAKLFTETIEYRNVIIPQTLGKAQVEANQDTHRCGWASNTKAACY